MTTAKENGKEGRNGMGGEGRVGEIGGGVGRDHED